MSTLPPNKYQLKSLHEEIDLFDRKLAHLLKYEAFANDAERDAAAGKMAAKRSLLVSKAQRMIDDGIEFKESELPKSLRPENPPAPPVAPSPEPAAPVATAPAVHPASLQASPHAGTSFQPELAAFKKKAKRKIA